YRSEDVALIRLDGIHRRSFLRLSAEWQGASLRYRTFGYPEDVATELDRGGRITVRPDLVYTEGHGRRRIQPYLTTITWTQFFELSEVAGPGCSGSPIIASGGDRWDVTGIYVGDRSSTNGVNVGFAAMVEAFGSWAPEILGCSLIEEPSSG